MKKKPVSPPSPLATQPVLSGIIERRPGDLKPWSRNPRTHSDEQLTKLMAGMRMFGFTIPVLVDESGVILGGHARVQAALKMNMKTIPTRVISGWTEPMKRAYVIADNKLALLSSWNMPLLAAEMSLVIESDLEIEITGFSTAEVDLMFPEDSGDPDDLQEEDIVAAVVTRPGDLWQLGTHRLLCDNALEAAAYQTLLDGARAQMVITDAPYNVPINGHVCGNGKVKHQEFAMASGEMSPSQFTAFLQGALTHMHASVVDGAIVYTFMDWRHVPELLAAAKPVFGAPRQLCTWIKDNAGMGTFYRSKHELIYVFKKGDAPHINNFELGQHGRYRTNVWEYPGVNTFKGKGFELLKLHPTVKPVSLIADAIRDCSHRKGLILDPFAGSGTILIAAERTGRYARAIELDPQYVDVAVQRWQRVTKKKAVLAATGQSWDEVRAERQPASAMVLDEEGDDDE